MDFLSNLGDALGPLATAFGSYNTSQTQADIAKLNAQAAAAAATATAKGKAASATIWPWIIGGVVVLALGLFLVFRKK